MHAQVEQHKYPCEQVSCLLLYTSADSMLDSLLDRPLDEGDVLSNANTILYLGKVRTGTKLGRALILPSTAAARPVTRSCPTRSTTPDCESDRPAARFLTAYRPLPTAYCLLLIAWLLNALPSKVVGASMNTSSCCPTYSRAPWLSIA